MRIIRSVGYVLVIIILVGMQFCINTENWIGLIKIYLSLIGGTLGGGLFYNVWRWTDK